MVTIFLIGIMWQSGKSNPNNCFLIMLRNTEADVRQLACFLDGFAYAMGMALNEISSLMSFIISIINVVSVIENY